jgi:hypothetical protein
MRATRSLPLLLVLAAAACGKDETPAGKTPATTEPAKSGAPSKTTPPKETRRELPKFPPLTEERARAVFHETLKDPRADDGTRLALLYSADLGDRSALDVANKLMEKKDGKYVALDEAALGAEALLAFKAPGAGAKALEVAKEFVAEEEAFGHEYVIHALARVEGEERAQATESLLQFARAFDEDEDMAALAVEALAKSGAPEARDDFAKIAGTKSLAGRIRGAAVAGLLRAGDPRGRQLAETLVKEATAQDASPHGTAPDDALDAESFLTGLGVEGAVEASSYVRKTVDGLLAADAMMTEGLPAMRSVARIHAAGGGADLVPWLRELAGKEDVDLEGEASFALWSLGEDAAAPKVASYLQRLLSEWPASVDSEMIVDIFDVAARRGVAGKPPIRALVETAAQLPARAEGAQGIATGVEEVNLAAAHAFLKSSR